jgi:uncharacterized membrane protein
MNLFKRNVETDDEFISKIRKRVKNYRRIAIAQFILSLVLLIVSFLFLFLIFTGTHPESFKGGTMYISFSLGAIVGALFAFSIEMMISNFIDAISNLNGRKEFTLLIKYYDQLNPSGSNK